MKYKKHSRGSSIGYVIEALVPFTEANLQLTFRPNAFFNELERRGHISASSARGAYYEAKRRHLIVFDENGPHLSDRALSMLHTRPAAALPDKQQCMVIFDIPEDFASKRRQLRTLLKELKFTQEQRSVWVNTEDYSSIVLDLIRELSLSPYAKVYFSTPLSS